MNPNELASILSSLGGGGGGGAAGLMQGLQRGASSQQRASPSRSNPFARQTGDSRPNTAPAGTRNAGTTTTTTRSTGASSRARNDESASATVPSNTDNSTKPSGTKSGPIQMDALTNVLANLGNNTTQETGATSSSKPAIDLCDIMTREVC